MHHCHKLHNYYYLVVLLLFL